jgi:hypothetical protein
MKCPSCSKFAALEMQDPEVNDVTLNADDLDSVTVTYDVRILRNSECCGDEMKEYTFAEDADVPAEIVEKMKAIRATEPDADFEAEDAGTEQVDEGGHRYKKSYFGFSMTVEIKHGSTTLGTFEITDKVQASGMDELN